MVNVIKDQLLLHADEPYQKFSSALIPNISNMLGVRLPVLRKLAKRVLQEDWRAYLDEDHEEYFEEVMLKGMIIGYAKLDMEDKLELIARFVPKIDNWSVCDSFCCGLKFTGTNREQMWSFLQPYLSSSKEYELRFGVVMILNYYIDEIYIDKVLQKLDTIKHPAYYVKMAVAWALSMCYVKLPEQTMAYLQHNTLDDFTYNKALQKIVESNRVTPDNKSVIRSMKRK